MPQENSVRTVSYAVVVPRKTARHTVAGAGLDLDPSRSPSSQIMASDLFQIETTQAVAGSGAVARRCHVIVPGRTAFIQTRFRREDGGT